MNILNEISNIGIIPVIKINDATKAAPLAKALIDGGLNAAEVTFRTAAAEDAIRAIANAYPDMLVGAGTVLTIEQAQRALDAGAKFIVSPGFNPKVVKWCLDNGVTPLPGCTTPSEIEQALELGLKVVKFFPADVYGGIKAIKALSAPFGQVKFLPTGGVSEANLYEFAANKSVIAVGGSWVCKKDDIINHDWEKITTLSSNAVRIIKETRT